MLDLMTPHLLDDLLSFIRVVEKGSFTDAADSLGCSKSIVSKRIARLEKNLGAKLLYRTTRSLTLTEVGGDFYKRGMQIGQDLEETIFQVSYAHSAPRGKIRLATPISFGTQHLAGCVADFMHRFPEIKVEFLLGNQYDDLYDNNLDLAIRIGSLPDSSLMARQLTVRAMRVCASPRYLKKHGIPREPKDLEQHNCLIHYNSRTGNEWHLQGPDGKNQRIKVSGNFMASSSQALEQAAVSDLGIVMMPGYMMTNDIKAGRLQYLLTDYCPKNIPVYAVYPPNRHLAPKIRSLVDYLVERFDQESYWGIQPF